MLNQLRHYIHQLRHPVLCEVWLLHSITTDYSQDRELRACEISPTTLESKIIDAMNQHKEFISVAELEKVIAKGNSRKEYICVTMDDGYRNNLTTALPIFMKYKVPFCVFVCPGFITGDVNPGIDVKKEMLSIVELQKLAQHSLCTIGAHSMSHQHLDQTTKEVQERELIESKRILEEWIGKEVSYLAYPYGSTNTDSYSALQMAGFHLGFGAWGGAMKKNDFNKWWIPRVIVSEKL